MKLRKCIIVGGHGGRSGVPAYIELLVEALQPYYKLSVISDINEGGYDQVKNVIGENNYFEVSGLASNLSPKKLILTWLKLKEILDSSNSPTLLWANSSVAVLLCRVYCFLNRSSYNKNIHLLVTYHGVPFGQGRNFSISKIMKAIEHLFLKISPIHNIIVISKKDYELLCDISSFKRHNIYLIQNCSRDVYLPSYNGQPQSPHSLNILMTTRLSYQKNIEAALKVFSYLPVNYSLTLLGKGTDTKDFLRVASDILPQECLNRIKFKGEVSEVQKFYSEACCYLMTSRYEGLPIGAIEALSAGLPIAMTDVGGSEEISIDNPFFILINTASASEIKAAASNIDQLIKSYLNNREDNMLQIRKLWEKRYSNIVWGEKILSMCETVSKQ